MSRLDPSNLNLGVFPMRNKIINGDFDIWQRGTTFAPIAANDYHADRWTYTTVGNAVFTITQDTDVPTVAQSGHLSKYSCKAQCTTNSDGDASNPATDPLAASAQTGVLQSIEGYNIKDLVQRAFTISFWVRATKTGIYCISLRNYDASQSFLAEYTVNVSDTWEKKTIPVSASPAAGGWNYETETGLMLYFALNMGTDKYGSTGWQADNKLSTANQVNACDSTLNSFFLSQVQVEPGEEASDFQTRQFGEELALCKRYFEMKKAALAGETFGAGFANTTNEYNVFMPFEVEKRVAATITTSAASNFRVRDNSGTIVVSSMGANFPSKRSVLWGGTATGAGSGEGLVLEAVSTSAEILIDAEL